MVVLCAWKSSHRWHWSASCHSDNTDTLSVRKNGREKERKKDPSILFSFRGSKPMAVRFPFLCLSFRLLPTEGFRGIIILLPWTNWGRVKGRVIRDDLSQVIIFYRWRAECQTPTFFRLQSNSYPTNLGGANFRSIDVNFGYPYQLKYFSISEWKKKGTN